MFTTSTQPDKQVTSCHQVCIKFTPHTISKQVLSMKCGHTGNVSKYRPTSCACLKTQFSHSKMHKVAVGSGDINPKI